jgi:hypothetical protein
VLARWRRNTQRRWQRPVCRLERIVLYIELGMPAPQRFHDRLQGLGRKRDPACGPGDDKAPMYVRDEFSARCYERRRPARAALCISRRDLNSERISPVN